MLGGFWSGGSWLPLGALVGKAAADLEASTGWKVRLLRFL